MPADAIRGLARSPRDSLSVIRNLPSAELAACRRYTQDARASPATGSPFKRSKPVELFCSPAVVEPWMLHCKLRMRLQMAEEGGNDWKSHCEIDRIADELPMTSSFAWDAGLLLGGVESVCLAPNFFFSWGLFLVQPRDGLQEQIRTKRSEIVPSLGLEFRA
ncbi:hypothetical protein BDW75DRAFT_94312 [Aspergillus navahoensis]